MPISPPTHANGAPDMLADTLAAAALVATLAALVEVLAGGGIADRIARALVD